MSKDKPKKNKTAKKTAAPTGMVVRSAGKAGPARAASLVPNQQVSSAKKGASISGPRKTGGA